MLLALKPLLLRVAGASLAGEGWVPGTRRGEQRAPEEQAGSDSAVQLSRHFS